MAEINGGDIVKIWLGGTEGIYRIESLRTTAKRFKTFSYAGVPAFGPKTTGIFFQILTLLTNSPMKKLLNYT